MRKVKGVGKRQQTKPPSFMLLLVVTSFLFPCGGSNLD
ncbi:hypothetical protein COLO4_00077 [Corchorus olitorius]|uniref:Uncharacterized protein n=1 Tax=Corchorus olitorius TaxID=93759 RepID=A0A1R3L4N3_9ROSI|nr:hypothetical protein COLO4_00077 [Corchorus olitorius]